jgi:hypothetical protein
VRSRTGLFTLCAITVLPLVYIVGLFVYVVAVQQLTPQALIGQFGWAPLLVPNLVAGLLIVGLLVAYLGELMRTPLVPEYRKPLWVVLMLVGHVFSMMAFWVLYIYLPWRAERAAAASAVVRAPVNAVRRPIPLRVYRHTRSLASTARPLRQQELETICGDDAP